MTNGNNVQSISSYFQAWYPVFPGYGRCADVFVEDEDAGDESWIDAQRFM